jgi:synaptojanin
MFLAVVTSCMHIGEIRPGESVHRILDVEFYSLTNNSYDSNRIYDENAQSDQPVSYVHPCAQLKKLLSNGHFYFSSDFDITRTMSARYELFAIIICVLTIYINERSNILIIGF